MSMEAAIPSAIAPLTETDWRAAHNSIAANNQGSAMKWLLPLLAGGTAAGALSGLAANRQKTRRASDLAEGLNYSPPAMPLATGKSASLRKSADLGGIGEFLAGANAHGSYGPLQVPWFAPAAIAAMYGGHQLGKGITTALGNHNVTADSEKALAEAKKKYTESVRQPLANPELVKQAYEKRAADWQPGMFSLDKWGPELGLGIGGVGALSMYNLLGKYHKEKLLAEKEKLGQRQQQLDVEANALRPTLPSRLPQPVAFNA